MTEGIISYIYKYKDISLDDSPFNEVDALVFAELSYFPFDLLEDKKTVYSIKDIQSFLKGYTPKNEAKRRRLDFELLIVSLASTRYQNMKIGYFVKDKSQEKEKQFQAVTFILPKFIYVAFAGTDASLTGWKEDLNLSYQNEIASDDSARDYLQQILKRFPFKDFYLGGHSKGGRLAVFAAKNIKNNKRIKEIYSFDGPGFNESFYDSKYEVIAPRIKKYIPEESIIGRLIHDEKNVIIISSSGKLIMQHDNYNWVVEDNHFVRVSSFSSKSNHIVNVINKSLDGLDLEERRLITDTVYELLLDLNVTEFGGADYNKALARYALMNFSDAWRNVNKARRRELKNFVLLILGLMVKEFLLPPSLIKKNIE